MKFYKRKMFYIPLSLFVALLLIVAVLFYKPAKLIAWVVLDYPKEVQTLAQYENSIKEPSVFLNNFTTFQPNLKDFQTLNAQIQTAKRDFALMDAIGLGEYYLDIANHLAKKFIYLSRAKRIFFTYTETKSLNESQAQQYQTILKNTQDLKDSISKEQFNFTQAYEDFYQSLKHTTNLVYIHQTNTHRFIINSSAIASIIYDESICPTPYEYVETLSLQMQESYTILKNLTPNADVLKYINQNSYEEFIAKGTGSMQYIQHFLSHCKRND